MAQLFVAQVNAIYRDDQKISGHTSVLGEVKQGRYELSPGQVTGSAKNDERRRLGLVIGFHDFHSFSQFSCEACSWHWSAHLRDKYGASCKFGRSRLAWNDAQISSSNAARIMQPLRQFHTVVAVAHFP